MNSAEVDDSVFRPSHYTFGKYEVIDVIEDWQLNYHRATVLKYLARAGRKSAETELQDLQKAAWFLNREIARLGKK